MSKKLLGLVVLVMLCVGVSGAATITQLCPPIETVTAASNPLIGIPSTTAVCPTWTIPAGNVVTAIDLFIGNDFELANGGASSLVFTYSGITNFNLTTITSTVSGVGTSSHWANSSCTQGVGPGAISLPNTFDCTDSVSMAGPGTVPSISVTGTAAWAAGSGGLQVGGTETFGITEVITYTQAPTISITKVAVSSPVVAGNPIGFAIVVANYGAVSDPAAMLSDPLPTGSGITWSISPAYSGPGTCSITAGTLNCAFGTLAAGASATVGVSSATVLATPCTPTTYSNTATASATSVTPVTASAPVTVTCPVVPPTNNPPAFQVSYCANNGAGESYINLINSGANGAPLLGPGFGAAAGNMCVNVYAFSPDEQEISCCSCLVTPNSVQNLGCNRDLTVKTLTGVIPTSVVVKLVATLAGGDGSGTTCSQTAAVDKDVNGRAIPLAAGLVAYGTTMQQNNLAGTTYNVVEHNFVQSTLSQGEWDSITGRCASILGNGSKYGICTSCQPGALGATKQ